LRVEVRGTRFGVENDRPFLASRPPGHLLETKKGISERETKKGIVLREWENKKGVRRTLVENGRVQRGNDAQSSLIIESHKENTWTMDFSTWTSLARFWSTSAAPGT